VPAPGAAGAAEALDLVVPLQQASTFALRAVDAAGNVSAIVSASVTTDFTEASFAGTAAEAEFGASVRGVDVDGDGLPDLIVGRPSLATNAGGLRVVYGNGRAPTDLTAAQLGLVLSAGSTGLLFGSLLMSVWGGPARRMTGVLGLSPVLGLGCIVMGAAGTLPLTIAGIFLLCFVLPIINGCDQAIWQTQVEPGLQGRIFGTRQLLEQFTAPLSYLAAGPLADRVFEPLLAPGGRLAGSVGRVLGVGPGRGIGLQFVTMGLLVIAATLCSLASSRLRTVEDEIPDAVPELPDASAAGVGGPTLALEG